MDKPHHLNEFQLVVESLDMLPFSGTGLELKVGMWRDSVVLKIQKRSWTNNPHNPPSFEESIFFSIWLSEQALAENKLSYNIHALKLRELKNYTIKSREFASAFRSKFKKFENAWPNVSTDYGPQTLMEGWTTLSPVNIAELMIPLVYSFLDIYSIIDELLEERKNRR